MNKQELLRHIEATGGKRAFARLMNISERYVDMLVAGDRAMSKELEELVRMKVGVGNDI